MNNVKLFKSIKKLYSFSGVAEKDGRHIVAEDLGLINDGCLLVADGTIKWVGAEKDFNSDILKEKNLSEPEEIHLNAESVLPAFVESHTHMIFAGDRKDEFELRNQGVSYQEIAKRGGGIKSTVEQTRKASEEELLKLAEVRAAKFLEQGVGVIEVKSGYGLNLEAELKMLKVAQKIKTAQIVPTFLGPHAIPKDSDIESYQNEILEKILPQLVQEALAQRVDIFVEQGFFGIDYAKKYIMKAKEMGLSFTVHAEQLSRTGATELAVEMGANSVDHLVEINASDISKLAGSQTVATLLPASDFYLQINYPPARDLIDKGACCALATDYNPGSSPTQDICFTGLLARLEMKMTLPEVLSAYTYGAAKALGLESKIASLSPEKLSHFICLDDSLESLFYSQGHHPVSEVWLSGEKKLKKP